MSAAIRFKQYLHIRLSESSPCCCSCENEGCECTGFRPKKRNEAPISLCISAQRRPPYQVRGGAKVVVRAGRSMPESVLSVLGQG